MPSSLTAQIQLPPLDELSLGNIFLRNRPISTTPAIPTSSTMQRRAASADFLTGKGLFTSKTAVSSCGGSSSSSSRSKPEAMTQRKAKAP
eukprot:CAMPEP_0204287002 /NCGR_PEP_ID=MMETSP0468-20130131/53858_1 /ASSEMBLY_ACC=CAM_ASM_000383 /TAXON_ID=2969 /ORGANISM="Oxyrrhis marina" /LENGTH=89 /DNA_ID=CAMNT_0051264949 /DNA_START=192 /DNA_END=458 /DNA_ORIENTATION=-